MRGKCIECGNDFSSEEMVNVAGGPVCKFCKDRYAQRIREGVTPPCESVGGAGGTQPVGKLGSRLVFLLKANVGLSVIAVLVRAYQYHVYSNLPEDFDIYNEFVPSETHALMVGLMQLILFLVLGYTFLKWIYRMNKNLRTVARGSMAFSPGWSIGYYFIPILNLYKPYQAMKEIWQVSGAGDKGSHSLVGGWWTLRLLSGVVREIAFRASTHVTDVDSQLLSIAAYMASDTADIFLTWVALRLVVRIRDAYAENYGDPQTLA